MLAVLLLLFSLLLFFLSFWGLAMRDFVDLVDFSQKTKARGCPPATGKSISA